MRASNLRATILILSFLFCGALAPAQTGGTAKSAQTASGTKQPPATKPPQPTGEQDAAAADLQKIRKPPLPEFHPQLPKRIQLENGMIVFLQEDHELPLINGVAYVYGGSKSEPADKIGLVSIYGGSWRIGGTKTKTGDQLDDELEARAARIETGGGVDTTTLRFSCLKGDLDFVLDDFNDILRNPEFREEKIEIAKNNLKTAIARRNDDVGQIALRESTKIGYGPQSPYARTPEYATVAAVAGQDMLDWHSRYVQPNNILLGITGDFDSAAMEAKLRQLFEGWQKGTAYERPQIAITPPKPGMYFIEKNDVNQSEIRMVASGIRRDDPDFYAVQVMNEIFGGGFSSRLVKNLRTKAGLAYSVAGGVTAPFDHPGLARLIMGTKSSTTALAIDGLYKQVEEMRDVPVTAAELQRGKDAILNSFIFQFDSKEKVLQEQMTYELYGYPPDFLERYQKGVEKVTAEDVDRVAQKYLVKDKFAVLVVGKTADFDKPLSSFGPVTNVDITIPMPSSTTTKQASDAGSAEGKALLTKVLDGAGGAGKLNAIKAMRVKARITPKGLGVALAAEEIEVLPDRLHSSVSTPGGEIVTVVGPQDSFIAMGAMGLKPMPTSQRDDQLNSLHRNLWSVAQHANDPQYRFTAAGTEKIGDVQAAVLEISGSNQQWRWYVDPQSGHVVRAQSEGTSPNGPATRTVDYSDWKPVAGITLPFHEELSVNGQNSATIVVESYELNPQVDPKIFEKPTEKADK